jgi:SAM-dependent methyltransferase
MRAAGLAPQRARHIVRDARIAWSDAVRRRQDVDAAIDIPGAYQIKAEYVERSIPEYDDLNTVGARWQASVYERARAEALKWRASYVFDVGCGDGRNHDLLGDLEIVGIDYGKNLEEARRRSPRGTFFEADLEDELPLPQAPTGSIIVCADVIEHLRRPDRLLAKLHALLADASVALISTPERDLWHGRDHIGPPPNKGHVREWNRSEFAALLAAYGFKGLTEIVRSNDVGIERKTTLAVVTRREVPFGAET